MWPFLKIKYGGQIPCLLSVVIGTKFLMKLYIIKYMCANCRAFVIHSAVDDHIVLECLIVLSALHSAILSPPLNPLNLKLLVHTVYTVHMKAHSFD